MILAGLALVVLQGCTFYHYEHIDPETGFSCVIDVQSMREFSGGRLLADKDCALIGGLDSASFNDKNYDAINALIGKIP